MLTSLDLLVIVFMIFAAAALLALCLMFLLRNQTAKKVCFYVVSVLGLYLSWVGFRIGIGGWFPMQMVIGILIALVFVGAFILERLRGKNPKIFLIARVLSASALGIAFLNVMF